MSTEKNIELLSRLGAYMLGNDDAWQNAKERAVQANPWFTSENIDLAITNIVHEFLQPAKLAAWMCAYFPTLSPKTIGIVMAGNIPLVGFHDFLCGFMSGQRLMLKLSSKDNILLTHLVEKLVTWEPQVSERIVIADRLNGCDAYIATGSNNSARYFEEYFGKYPHIIRKNRTSVAILAGNEIREELLLLADDVFMYYGLGCRNVTQVFVPSGYDFTPMLDAFKKYDSLFMHHKYKNNYDYHLAIYLLNRVPYMTNDTLLMVENDIPFSAVSVLHYQYYSDKQLLTDTLLNNEAIQAIIGTGFVPFGTSQLPSLNDYADGVDTMRFLCGL